MLESTIERYLVRQVRARGGDARKVHWIGRRGAPDRMVLRKYRIPCFVELKAPGQQLRPDQAREIALLRSYGVEVHVIDSLEGVDALLSS